jgi:type II secretory pathway pseudopilin PulG
MFPPSTGFRAAQSIRGMTLVELTLVISTLLGIAGLTLFGSAHFKEGANRALCLHQTANIQKAMRSYCNLHQIEPDSKIEDLQELVVVESGFLATEPRCPSGGIYSYYKGRVPNIGTPFARCSHPDHVPKDTHSW